MVKLNTSLLFGHNEIVVISLVFLVTFTFDWIWGTLFYSKSCYESFLVIFSKILTYSSKHSIKQTGRCIRSTEIN